MPALALACINGTANMRYTVLLCGLLLLLIVRQAGAVSGVNPSGVNVRSSGATSVFLTFQNLDANEDALESFFLRRA